MTAAPEGIGQAKERRCSQTKAGDLGGVHDHVEQASDDLLLGIDPQLFPLASSMLSTSRPDAVFRLSVLT